jgi:hypothetical protein
MQRHLAVRHFYYLRFEQWRDDVAWCSSNEEVRTRLPFAPPTVGASGEPPQGGSHHSPMRYGIAKDQGNSFHIPNGVYGT